MGRVNHRERLEGTVIGAWQVQAYAGGGKYECTCDCGTTKLVEAISLRRKD